MELLDVAETLHRRGLQFEFRFAGFNPGPTPYITAFFNRIKSMTEAGYARYLGSPSNTELVRYYDEAAAMVDFPTELSFGNVVVEGLSRDLKFFGSRVGGIVDTAKEMPAANCFPPMTGPV